jgi:hypothetical protein
VSRLIEIGPDDVSGELVLAVGDVVRFAATGGHVRSGAAVEIVGILTDSVLGTDGSVLTPLGPPGTVLLRARSPGRAEVDVVSGDPFHSPVTRSLVIRVE